jgi:hypothetical protein
MGKHAADKKSLTQPNEHNKVGTTPQAPKIDSWGRS